MNWRHEQSSELRKVDCAVIQGTERRRVSRRGFFADVEIVLEDSRICFQARANDISLLGCSILCSKHFPLGSVMQIRMLYKNQAVVIAGKVIHRELQEGIGIEFGELESDQKTLLENWLAETDDCQVLSNAQTG